MYQETVALHLEDDKKISRVELVSAAHQVNLVLVVIVLTGENKYISFH